LACANVDGTLARRRPGNPFGGVINELGDRAADLVMLAGFIPFLGSSTAVLMLAATLPSWAALAVAANGGPRSNSGPMGKTERCALAALAAATGWYSLVALVVAVGCAATAIVRLRAGHRSLSDGAGR
jgi:CDP-diacylglycerol--glycerol-3-phosphate 3-phosphatidyltransferase